MKKKTSIDVLSDIEKNIKDIENRLQEERKEIDSKISLLTIDKEELHLRNKELSKDLNSAKAKVEGLEAQLEIRNKRVERYQEIFKKLPGTPENKVELLEYFTNEIIPSISKKIESKHTNKIKEYLDKEILNREEEVGEELYNLVLGTHLEFLFPYLIAGYIEIDYRALKSYIKNPSTLAYKNWKKKIFDIKEISRGHLSCPIYTDVDFGVHNPISFSDKCVIELSAYFINGGNMEYIESLRGCLLKILNSNSLKIKYGLPVKTDVMVYEECENYPDMIRMFLWEYIKNKGN